MGKLDDAIYHYLEVVARDETCTEAYVNLGVAHAARGARGDVRKTADYYAKAISIDPTCLVAHYNLALHLKQEKQLDAALCSFKKVLDLDPNDPTVHSQTGWLMLDIHRQKAQNNWQQVNKFVTGDPEQAALMLEQEALAQKQEEE